jgi:hypothetical protein
MMEGYFTMAFPALLDAFRARPAGPRLRGLPVAVASLTGLALAAAPGMAAAAPHAHGTAASAPAVTAYAIGNKPFTPSYTPERGFSFNSTGQAIRIVRSGTGTYTVRFFGLGAFAQQGTVDVTAEGVQAAQCAVVHWLPDSTGTILLVRVNCFDLSGVKMDAPFMVAYTSGGSTTGTTDFVWADQPAAANYTPSAPFQFNSSGGINTVKHLGPGQYRVTMPGPDVADGAVKVTAYGGNANSCQVVQWVNVTAGQHVFVDCFTPAGALVNNRFTMTFTAGDDLFGDGGPSGYLWGNDPSSASYTPDGAYQFDTAGSSATVTRFGVGEYETLFPNETHGAQGDEQATPYGSTPAHCVVDGPVGNATSEQGDVFCYDINGNQLDTTYTMQWMIF